MSYTGSLAGSGDGTLFQINTGTSGTPTWTTIGEMTKAPWSGRKNNTTKVTNFQSSADEFIATLPTSGDFKVAYNYVATDAGQIALAAAFAGKTRPQFKVTIPPTGTQTTSGDVVTFTALVEELNPFASLTPDGAIQAEGSLKLSGTPTITAGT